MIRVGLIGVGNCASALLDGLVYYRKHNTEIGLAHPLVGGFSPGDIDVVAAFDVDPKKVGTHLWHGCRAGVNNYPFQTSISDWGIHLDSEPTIHAGLLNDGLGTRYSEIVPSASSSSEDEVASVIKSKNLDVLVNYLPVGSSVDSRRYAAIAAGLGVSFVNCIPEFLSRDEDVVLMFSKSVLLGDDIKSQVGATIIHRALVDVFSRRGAILDRTYQLNVGGNMDFYNMLNSERLQSKRASKQGSVTSVANSGKGLAPENVHIGPSDYVRWLGDTKVALIRLEGRVWSGQSITVDMRMDVVDSANSAGVVIDAIRAAHTATITGTRGVLQVAAGWLMKSPPFPVSDEEAYNDFVSLYCQTEKRGLKIAAGA